MRKALPFFCVILLVTACSDTSKAQSRVDDARMRIEKRLHRDVEANGHQWGAPIFIRIFKQTNALEVWMQQDDEKFQLYKSYPICTWSGKLGPKIKQGDHQAPEGFYFVTPGAMNPQSQFHLSFNLGYPNAYDRAHGRTGNYLMVHGDCVSVGCYAMTDRAIEEIYLLAEAAFANRQPFFRVHIFPFPMTDANMTMHETSPWRDFWKNLKTGHDWFEAKKTPPDVTVQAKQYYFSD